MDQNGVSQWNQSFKEKEDKSVGIQTGTKPFDALFDMLSKKIASIKRHFLSSPYEIMLDAIALNSKDKTANKSVNNLSFYTKAEKKEKIWLAFESIYCLIM